MTALVSYMISLVLKVAYSNFYMKLSLATKPTRYFTNIYELRFLLRNFLKYTHQCQNGVTENMCLPIMVP